jgi:hypothetical protein
MGKIFILLLLLIIAVPAQPIINSNIVYKPHSKYVTISDLDSTIVTYRTKHSVINISLQILAGEGAAVAASIPSFVMLSGSLHEGGSATTGLIGIALFFPAYITGTAAGVQWIAQIENKNHSYWQTVQYAFVGGLAAAGLGALLAEKHRTIPTGGGIIMALCPLAGALTYSLFIEDWPEEPEEVATFEKENLKENSYLVKDIFERSLIVKLELFRVNL